MNKSTKQLKSLLALHLEQSHGEYALYRYDKNEWKLGLSGSFELSTHFWSASTDIAAASLKQSLEQHSILNHPCTLSLPTNWVRSATLELDTVPEEHLDNFIQLQAEQRFEIHPDELQIDHCTTKVSENKKLALVWGVSNRHTDRLESILEQSSLKLIHMSSALPYLARNYVQNQNLVFLDIQEETASFLVFYRGQPIFQRHFRHRSALQEDLDQRFDSLCREIRISINNCPQIIVDCLNSLTCISTHALQEDLFKSSLNQNGLGFLEQVKVITHNQDAPYAQALVHTPDPIQKVQPEFLHPKPTKVELWLEKYASKKVTLISSAATILFVLGLVYTLIQAQLLNHKENIYKELLPMTKEVEAAQERINLYKNYFSSKSWQLQAWNTIAECFPNTGDLYVETLHFKIEKSKNSKKRTRAPELLVECQGIAQSIETYRDVKSKLLEHKNILSLRNVEEPSSGSNQFQFIIVWKST